MKWPSFKISAKLSKLLRFQSRILPRENHQAKQENSVKYGVKSGQDCYKINANQICLHPAMPEISPCNHTGNLGQAV